MKTCLSFCRNPAAECIRMPTRTTRMPSDLSVSLFGVIQNEGHRSKIQKNSGRKYQGHAITATPNSPNLHTVLYKERHYINRPHRSRDMLRDWIRSCPSSQHSALDLRTRNMPMWSGFVLRSAVCLSECVWIIRRETWSAISDSTIARALIHNSGPVNPQDPALAFPEHISAAHINIRRLMLAHIRPVSLYVVCDERGCFSPGCPGFIDKLENNLSHAASPGSVQST